MNKNGQAAMNFILTYGWAILAAAMGIGLLAYLGVFSPYNHNPNVTNLIIQDCSNALYSKINVNNHTQCFDTVCKGYDSNATWGGSFNTNSFTILCKRGEIGVDVHIFNITECLPFEQDVFEFLKCKHDLNITT